MRAKKEKERLRKRKEWRKLDPLDPARDRLLICGAIVDLLIHSAYTAPEFNLLFHRHSLYRIMLSIRGHS